MKNIEVGSKIYFHVEGHDGSLFVVDGEETPPPALTDDMDEPNVVQIITGTWEPKHFRGIGLVMSNGELDLMRPELQFAKEEWSIGV